MVRSLNQIEQEMTALQQTVAAIAEEFHDAYAQYLEALGQAVRQQLILACYHLCTHGYPDAFLSLTFAQRQELQQTLRKLAQQAQTEMSSLLQPILPRDLSDEGDEDELEEGDEDLEEESDDPADEDGASQGFLSSSADLDLPTALRFLQKAMQPDPDEASVSQDSPEEAADQSKQNSDAESNNEPDNERDNEPDNEPDDEPDDEPPIEDRPLTPKDLLYWQHRLEESIVDDLYQLSHATNRLMYRSELLPHQLPEPILEVATKAELSAEATASPPNLLSLMIETRSEDSKKPVMAHIVAVRLRLSEIEFASGSLSVWRSRIRELSARLSKLGRDYYQKQRERSIAQAEAAWRSSWYED